MKQMDSPINSQKLFVSLASALALSLFGYLFTQNPQKPFLFIIGCGLGITLYHATFGFTGAYRRAIRQKDISGISAQLLMIGIAVLLFAPILAMGNVFEHRVGGAFAPVSVSMALGALIFGVGMQLGGGCASGTLFTAGGGSVRMWVVLVFFCIGTFIASLHLSWWRALPSAGTVSLGKELGWGVAVPLQLTALFLVYALLRWLGGENKKPLWWRSSLSWHHLLYGPWPLLQAGIVLALLNWATLLVAGHPWSVTWGFTLWAAKAGMLLGWDPSTSAFWSSAFASKALSQSILRDTTSVMNIGILIGAFLAASLAGYIRFERRIPLLSLIAAIGGGLLLGYGARLAYGCNIGAFFSGIASSSLHGWVWIAAAIFGNIIGVHLRPVFKLD